MPSDADHAKACRADRRWWFDLAVISLLLAFPSAGFLQKYMGLPGVAAYGVFVAIVTVLAGRFGGWFVPWVERRFRLLAAMTIGGLLAGFLFLHPFEDGKGPGKSSDRDEALEIAVSRMAAGETPYYPSHPDAGPLSLLPGSIFLASPFVALGSVGCQNVFWLTAFLLVAAHRLKRKTAALCLLVVPLAVSPAAWYEFVSGGDLIANGVFVALLLLFALNAWSEPRGSAWQRGVASLLLGIGLASRPNFLLLAPLFGAVVWRRTGLRQALVAVALVGATAVAVILPFYLNDPAGFTPLLARQKLGVADRVLPWASRAMIGSTLLAVAFATWRLSRGAEVDPVPRFFRWCAAVTLVPMIGAVSFASWVSGGTDFSFLRDRFGLMYVFFALLGWGGRWFSNPGEASSPFTFSDRSHAS